MYILDIIVLSNIWLSNIFCHPLGCFFSLSVVSFAVTKLFLVVCRPTCLFLLSLPALWVSYYKVITSPTVEELFPCVFLVEFCGWGFAFKSLILVWVLLSWKCVSFCQMFLLYQMKCDGHIFFPSVNVVCYKFWFCKVNSACILWYISLGQVVWVCVCINIYIL